MAKQHFTLYVDGASKRNPGHSGIGFLIYNGAGEVVTEGARYIGETTSNVAEYTAVHDALEKAIDLGLESVEIRSDSQLIVKQLNNEFKVRSSRLKPLYYNVRNLLREFSTFSIVKIPREENNLADKLASSAIKEHLGGTKKGKSRSSKQTKARKARSKLKRRSIEPEQIDPPKKRRKTVRRWV